MAGTTTTSFPIYALSGTDCALTRNRRNGNIVWQVYNVGGVQRRFVGKRRCFFPSSQRLPPSFSHPGGVKNKWIYRQRASITVAGETRRRIVMGLAFFDTHIHTYTRNRSFLPAPKRTIRLFFRVILRNFHDRIVSPLFLPFPPLLCLLHLSNDRLSNESISRYSRPFFG